jgi:HAD superfamily hydrolase (TIGR01450 family)
MGSNIIEGALDFISNLQKNNKKFFLLSNNSSLHRRDRLKKMQKLGFKVELNNILTSTKATIVYLQKNRIKKIFLLGTPSVTEEFEEAGIYVDESSPEAVILAFDLTLTYEKLEKAAKLILKGVPYYATHLDFVCPTEDGPIPDAGSFAALFEAATGRRPDKVFGKPDPNMILKIIENFGIPLDKTVMIGDRLYTDVEMGKRAKVISVCVLSGETQIKDLEENYPDVVVDSVKDLIFS